jgi:hypothetical protein
VIRQPSRRSDRNKALELSSPRPWSHVSYGAETHTVPSPSGTRAVFASDWGNGTTVDTYVLELRSYST